MEVNIRNLIASMNIGDWITLSAVVIALALGLASLIQTNCIQKTERKQRLLNEIIDWATDVGKCGSHIDFLLLAAELDEEPWGELNLPTLQSSLRELKQRGEYMVKVADTLEKPLLTSVQKVKGKVTEYLKAIDNVFIKVKLGTEGNLPMILKPLLERDPLVNYANNLLAEATKIKTKDIG